MFSAFESFTRGETFTCKRSVKRISVWLKKSIEELKCPYSRLTCVLLKHDLTNRLTVSIEVLNACFYRTALRIWLTTGLSAVSSLLLSTGLSARSTLFRFRPCIIGRTVRGSINNRPICGVILNCSSYRSAYLRDRPWSVLPVDRLICEIDVICSSIIHLLPGLPVYAKLSFPVLTVLWVSSLDHVLWVSSLDYLMGSWYSVGWRVRVQGEKGEVLGVRCYADYHIRTASLGYALLIYLAGSRGSFNIM